MGTARAPCSASGVPPACSARVRKPKVCSAIGLLLVYLPACVRGVDSGSTLYCATSGGVHQVRVPICRLLRIMTGWILVGLKLVASAPPIPHCTILQAPTPVPVPVFLLRILHRPEGEDVSQIYNFY